MWLLPTGREQPAIAFATPRAKVLWPLDAAAPEKARTDALRQARIWMPADAATVDLAGNPPDPSGTLSEPLVRCYYLDSPARGTTAKFDCVLSDGEVVKVKYGHTGEIHAEIASSRLLNALGFGADRKFLIPRVRCYGCVLTPFYTNWGSIAYTRANWSRARFPKAVTPTSSGPRSSAISAVCQSRPASGRDGHGSSWTQSTPRSAPTAWNGTRCASPRCSSPTGTTRPRTSGSSASHPRPPMPLRVRARLR